MPSISRAYHAHAGNYTPGGNSHEYIVVHNTGNTASALNEARYAQNNRHDSSYHYVLDGSGTIYQILDDTDTAWSVGAWSGARQLIANRQSINIEVCSDGDRFSEAEISELAWLVQRLMAEYGIPADRVMRHYDCHTGHKRCPYAYSGDAANNAAWNALHERITKGEEMDYRIEAPDTVYVGQTVPVDVVPDLTYNHAWAFGDGWSDWDSDMKHGDAVVESSSSFTPSKAGRYRLWADVFDADGGKDTTPTHWVTVLDGHAPEQTILPVQESFEIDYDALAEIVAQKLIERLRN